MAPSMSGFLSVLFPEKYAGYERGLDRIDKSLKAANVTSKWYEGVRRRVKNWSLAFFVLSLSASLVWVFKLKQEAHGLGAWEHVKHVATALSVPVVVEILRRVAVGSISVWMSFLKGRTKRLEQQREHILKDLKDSTNFERISKIIEKYDPKERAKLRARAAALTTPGSGRSPSAVQRPATNTPMRGAAVIQFLQSTGQALSPMVDKIAMALDDEPSRKACIRQLVTERDALKQDVRALKMRLSRYEEVFDAQENQPPAAPALLGPPPLLDGQENQPPAVPPMLGRSEEQMHQAGPGHLHVRDGSLDSQPSNAPALAEDVNSEGGADAGVLSGADAARAAEVPLAEPDEADAMDLDTPVVRPTAGGTRRRRRHDGT